MTPYFATLLINTHQHINARLNHGINMDKTEVLVLMNKSLKNPITMNNIKIDSIDTSTVE